MKLHSLGIALGAVLAVGVAPSPHVGVQSSEGVETALETVESSARACCKICRKGKACGDSCIARHLTCHKPRGCACNGALSLDEVDGDKGEVD